MNRDLEKYHTDRYIQYPEAKHVKQTFGPDIDLAPPDVMNRKGQQCQTADQKPQKIKLNRIDSMYQFGNDFKRPENQNGDRQINVSLIHNISCPSKNVPPDIRLTSQCPQRGGLLPVISLRLHAAVNHFF